MWKSDSQALGDELGWVSDMMSRFRDFIASWLPCLLRWSDDVLVVSEGFIGGAVVMVYGDSIWRFRSIGKDA